MQYIVNGTKATGSDEQMDAKIVSRLRSKQWRLLTIAVILFAFPIFRFKLIITDSEAQHETKEGNAAKKTKSQSLALWLNFGSSRKDCS
jgi:hypothetical protein